jgi:ribosomal protein S18 acetylase RimI-like enzyme
MSERPGPAVRPGRPGDEAAIAPILVDGLGAKLLPAFGRRAARAVEAMVRHGLEALEPAYRVATVEGRVVGVVHLDMGAAGESSLLGVLRREIGLLGTARASIVLGALAPPVPSRDEAVVEELAVAPSARRCGVATALLRRCADDARAHGHGALILQVTTDNEPAIGLYRRAGFVVRSRRSWRLRRRLFGSPGCLIMKKTLGAPARPSGARRGR